MSSDTTPPAVSITSPTSSPTYATSSGSLGIGGSASDNVAVTQVTWANNRGGSGTATGTSTWSVAGIALQSGSNVITVTARDAAGNTGTETLTVTYTPPDTTPPAVSITSPTSSPTYATSSSSLGIGGSASDNVAVTQVTWANNRGGSGTATGTSSWSVTGITLQSGSNVITVTARDAAGNTATDDPYRHLHAARHHAACRQHHFAYIEPDLRHELQFARHRRLGFGQCRGHPGDLGQQSGRKRHGHRHIVLVGHGHHPAERIQRHHRHRA